MNILQRKTTTEIERIEHLDQPVIESCLQGTFDYNTVKLAYRFFGEKHKPCIVIIFDPQLQSNILLPYISGSDILTDFDIFLLDFDLRNTHNDFSIGDLAQSIYETVQQLGLTQNHVSLFGLSDGSIIAAELLRRNSHLIDKAVFSGIILTDEKLYQYNAKTAQELLNLDYAAYLNNHILNRLNFNNYKSLNDPYIEKIKQIFYPKERKEISKKFNHTKISYINTVQSYQNDFMRIKNSILVIAGDKDYITPLYVQERAMNIFSASQRNYNDRGCKSLYFIDNPKQFFKQVSNFFDYK